MVPTVNQFTVELGLVFSAKVLPKKKCPYAQNRDKREAAKPLNTVPLPGTPTKISYPYNIADLIAYPDLREQIRNWIQKLRHRGRPLSQVDPQ